MAYQSDVNAIFFGTMDPDVTSHRFTRKLFTFLWLKHGLIATFPAPDPTSPPRINDISEKVAKSAIVYSYANRHVVQYYMEKHIRRIAQSKISFWTHLSFLCLRIRLRNDNLFDYFLSICSITSEVALFCNWQKLDDVHTYASTFFEAFFERELSYYFYNAGGWPRLMNYIDDNNLLLAYDMVKPYESEMACPCNRVPVLVRVGAEKLSAERRERIASSRELKSEEIERMETVRLFAAKIFDWEFMKQLHISSLKPGVFKRVANIRRKSRSKTMSTDLSKPQSSRDLAKGDDQQEQGARNLVSQMNRSSDLRSPEHSAALHDKTDFHQLVSVSGNPSSESLSSLPKDELYYPTVSVDNDSNGSFLVTSSWLKPQETKYERHRRQSGVSTSTSNASSRSSQSHDTTLNRRSQTDFSPIKELMCSETSLKYDDNGEVFSSVQSISSENEGAVLDVIQTMTSTNLSSKYDDYIEEHSPNILNANGKSKVIDLNSAQRKTSISSLPLECESYAEKRNLNAENMFPENNAIDLDITKVEMNTNPSNCISSNDGSCIEMQTNLNISTKPIYFICENKFQKSSASKQDIAAQIAENELSTRNRTDFFSNSPTSSKQTNSNGSTTIHSDLEHSSNKSIEEQTSPNALCAKRPKAIHLSNTPLEIQTYQNASFTKQSKNEHSINGPLKMNPNTCFVKQFYVEHSSNGSSERPSKELKNNYVTILNGVEFQAKGANSYSSVTSNLDSNHEIIDLHQSSNQPFDFAKGVESVAIGRNGTVHYKKHHTGSFSKITDRIKMETGPESSIRNKQSSAGISKELKILSNSDSTESRSEPQSSERLDRDRKNIEKLVNTLKKMGVSDPVVFKI